MRKSGLAKVGVGTQPTGTQFKSGAGEKENQVELACFSAFQQQEINGSKVKTDVSFVDSHAPDTAELEEIVVSPVSGEDQQETEDGPNDASKESVVHKLARRTVVAKMASVGLTHGHAENGDTEPLLKHDSNVKKMTKPKGAWKVSPNIPETGGTVLAQPANFDQRGWSDLERDGEGNEQRGPPMFRRNSTGNMKTNVNAGNLRATIRRLQSRRFRPNKKSITVTIVQHFLAFLFYVGMSPLKPASAKKLPKWFLRIQTGFFAIFVSISSAHAIGQVKESWIIFGGEKDLISFVAFGFLASNCVARLYNIYVLSFSEKDVSELLAKIDKINSRAHSKQSNWTRTATISLATLSMTLVAFVTIFGNIPLKEWSVEEAALDRSYELSEILFSWTVTDYKTNTKYLLINYGNELNWTTGLLAAVYTVMTYCASLHGCMMLDLWPIISLQICILQMCFTNALKTAGQGKRLPDGRLECSLSAHWNQYMELREVCDKMESVFGSQMKFIHMQNILLFGYYLVQIMAKEPLSAELLVDTFSVLKVAVTYFMVQKSAEKNDKYEGCVITCSERSHTIWMNGREMSVPVLLEDMKRHPIGVGRGDFFVNQAFALKIVCAVGSIFMLLSQQLEEQQANK